MTLSEITQEVGPSPSAPAVRVTAAGDGNIFHELPIAHVVDVAQHWIQQMQAAARSAAPAEGPSISTAFHRRRSR